MTQQPSYKVLFTLLKLIAICGHFLTVNNRRYGRCYVKKYIPPCTFLEFYTHLEADSARSFQNAFYKCSRALNIVFSKTSYIWWMSSFFSLSSHLNRAAMTERGSCSAGCLFFWGADQCQASARPAIESRNLWCLFAKSCWNINRQIMLHIVFSLYCVKYIFSWCYPLCPELVGDKKD